jgi:hypothetical protein
MEEELKSVLCSPQTISLVSLMAANVLLAIIAALKDNTFSFRNLGDFVPNRFLPLVVYIVIAFLSRISNEWVAVVVTVYAGLVAMYSAAILAAVKSITGIEIPNVITDKKK